MWHNEDLAEAANPELKVKAMIPMYELLKIVKCKNCARYTNEKRMAHKRIHDLVHLENLTNSRQGTDKKADLYTAAGATTVRKLNLVISRSALFSSSSLGLFGYKVKHYILYLGSTARGNKGGLGNEIMAKGSHFDSDGSAYPSGYERCI
jgi:hypothetical protein